MTGFTSGHCLGTCTGKQPVRGRDPLRDVDSRHGPGDQRLCVCQYAWPRAAGRGLCRSFWDRTVDFVGLVLVGGIALVHFAFELNRNSLPLPAVERNLR